MWEKVIAGVLILLGTQGYGLSLSQETKCVLYHLNEQKQMLFYIVREIDFLHRPIPEIFQSLSERLRKPYNTFLKRVADRLENGSGRSLSEIWEEELDELEKERGYPKTAMEYLRKMKRCFSCEEDEMQKETFAMLREELEEEAMRIQGSRRERDRLIRTLSLLAGILCIVIFV